jgi:hypothetical protein
MHKYKYANAQALYGLLLKDIVVKSGCDFDMLKSWYRTDVHG